MNLCLLYILVASVASAYVRQLLPRVINTLGGNVISRIRFPSEAAIAEYARLKATRKPAVTNIIGFLNGVSIMFSVQMIL